MNLGLPQYIITMLSFALQVTTRNDYLIYHAMIILCLEMSSQYILTVFNVANYQK